MDATTDVTSVERELAIAASPETVSATECAGTDPKSTARAGVACP